MKQEKKQLHHRKYKGLIRKCYEQPYAKKLDTLEEIDKFLEAYNLPRLNQQKTKI